MGMQAGDVVKVFAKPNEELKIKVGGEYKFLGLPGISGKHMAVTVTQKLQDKTKTMSDENMLSQDEIDALLQGDLGLDELDEEMRILGVQEPVEVLVVGKGGSGIYTAEQIRALHEVVDSCFISEINVLSEYVQQEVALSNSKTPELVTEDRLKDELLSTQHIFVTFDFEEGKSGLVLGRNS